MNKRNSERRKLNWTGWISPIGMGVSLYVLLRLILGQAELFTQEMQRTLPGQVPNVNYSLTLSGLGAILAGGVFLTFFLMALRQWSRYYLNRKLLLSNLFLAMIPLCTTVPIIFLLVRVWFGISNANTMENAMEVFRHELENFALSLHGRVEEHLKAPNTDEWNKLLAIAINKYRLNDTGTQRFIKEGEIDIEIYYLTEKVPGSPVQVFPLYPESDRGMFPADSEEYERISPPWLRTENYTGVVERDNKLQILHVSTKVVKAYSGKVTVIAAIPIDGTFLDKLRQFQEVRIRLEALNGEWQYFSEMSDDSWQMRMLVKPLGTTWELQAMKWITGQYANVARIRFEVAPSEIMDTMRHNSGIPFFLQEQKLFRLNIILVLGLLLFLAEIIAYSVGFYLVAYITRSLNLMALGHEAVAGGKFDFRLPYLGRDQIGAMGRSFNAMTSNIESLLAQVREKEKYQEELRIARKIQQSLLPDLNTLPWCHNIAATCIPAREVGGDYYEVVCVEETGEIGIFIADVSGKGTSAAFYMAELKGILLALRHLWGDPLQLMSSLNEVLKPALNPNVFVSAAYCIFNPDNGGSQLVRAGHCPALLLSRDGTTRELMPPGMALGLANTPIFSKIIQVETFQLEVGDKIVLFTDGLDEMSHKDELYGIERLHQILRSHATLASEALKDAILKSVLDFLSQGEQSDDLTLVVAGRPSEVLGPGSPERAEDVLAGTASSENLNRQN